jgi:hypothetical protein
MFTDRDHKFATDILNASLTLMSILIAVITVLVVKYDEVKDYPAMAEPVRTAVIGTTLASTVAGAIAFGALTLLRSERWSTAFLAWPFGLLIAGMTLGIWYVVYSLIS